MQQIVCRFAKREEVKYISHLDLMRALERAMRRAGLSLAYSEGFNPRPRASYAAALAVGHTSDCELVAFWLRQPMDPEDVRAALNANLPRGLEVLQAWAVPAHKPKTTLGDIDTAEYIVRIAGPLHRIDVPQRAAQFAAQDEFYVRRVSDKRAKEFNLRPLVKALEVVAASSEGAELHLRLRTGSSGGARPEEVLHALGIQGREFRISVHRSALYASGAAGRAARQRLRRQLDRKS